MGLISLIVYQIIQVIVGHRVKPNDEILGLDVPEMGLPGYVGVKLDRHSETPLPKMPAPVFASSHPSEREFDPLTESLK